VKQASCYDIQIIAARNSRKQSDCLGNEKSKVGVKKQDTTRMSYRILLCQRYQASKAIKASDFALACFGMTLALPHGQEVGR
jgi:hypothetical protein